MAVVGLAIEALTTREREVLLNVMEGFSNREIAGQLFVSPETVKTHITNIMSKLGARDRTHAVVLAIRTNQLEIGR
jgi:DNA-binding NarL/FixJ family response regulator